MDSSVPVAAGSVATIVFALSMLPMLGKAARTRDLASYSRSNLVLANVGNAFYSLYEFHLPPGPIWLLHTFYAVTSALMLLWSVRYGRPTATPRSTLCVPNTSKP
ncbi:MAG TPA: hypothetical protein VNC14_06140 [Lapillicoccus sp.]|jgi:uncharacterized protein with PQ loop repeat|nr:hypothetical protein [Lapillicoccus sp.]